MTSFTSNVNMNERIQLISKTMNQSIEAGPLTVSHAWKIPKDYLR